MSLVDTLKEKKQVNNIYRKTGTYILETIVIRGQDTYSTTVHLVKKKKIKPI